MRKKYKISRKAQQDLSEIWRYTLEKWSIEQADIYIGSILSAFADIERAPELLGRPFDDIRNGYRKYPVGKHIIFYRLLSDGTVFISRILHERMNFDRHLKK